MKKDKSYIEIQESFKNVRRALERLNEEDEKDNKDKGNDAESNDAVPYTQQDELMTNAIQSAKQQFGADFSKCKTPMLYYPKDGDVVLSGVIPSLNSAKFQFRLLDASGGGCFFWVDSIQLTDENLKTMGVVLGVYKNWKKELLVANDRKPMSLHNEDN